MHHNKKNDDMWKYLQCKSFVFHCKSCKRIYWKKGKKYLIFDDSVNENKGLLKKYGDVWDGITSEIIAINVGEENNYGKDYRKIKEGSKLYPQVFLDDMLHEL